jgi:hypothetical protein
LVVSKHNPKFITQDIPQVSSKKSFQAVRNDGLPKKSGKSSKNILNS